MKLAYVFFDSYLKLFWDFLFYHLRIFDWYIVPISFLFDRLRARRNDRHRNNWIINQGHESLESSLINYWERGWAHDFSWWFIACFPNQARRRLHKGATDSGWEFVLLNHNYELVINILFEKQLVLGWVLLHHVLHLDSFGFSCCFIFCFFLLFLFCFFFQFFLAHFAASALLIRRLGHIQRLGTFFCLLSLFFRFFLRFDMLFISAFCVSKFVNQRIIY